MKQIIDNKTRGVALLTGGVLAASAFMHPSAAQAADKSKSYKVGAGVLGAAAAVLLLKKKTLPAVLAGAGAYYAYKKSKDSKQERQAEYPRYPDYYSRNPDNSYPPATDYDYGYQPADRYPDSDPYYSDRDGAYALR
jgi:hypothetical protein